MADEWAELDGPMELEIECYDSPAGQFRVEYNSPQGDYKSVTKAVTLAGKPAWKVVKLALPDPRFRNRQNQRADLRIRREPGAPVYVHRMALRRIEENETR